MKNSLLAAILVLAAALVLVHSAQGRQLEIFGWVEWVELMEGEVRMKAKLDSGAANSSLDATDIERFRKDGKRWVRFTLTDPESEESMTVEKPLERNVRIVRHDGERQRRPVIKMEICLGDVAQEVEVNLIDRSEFIYPLLLGRSALEQFALIDSGETFLFGPECYEQDDEE